MHFFCRTNWVFLSIFSLIFITGCENPQEFRRTVMLLDAGFSYGAKSICSDIFVSGFSKEASLKMMKPTLDQMGLPVIWKLEVDEINQTVTIKDTLFNGLFTEKALYREGLGCTILRGTPIEELLAQRPVIPQPQLKTIKRSKRSTAKQAPWPYGMGGVNRENLSWVDFTAIEAAIDQAFVETSNVSRQTQAVLVIYQQQLIAERYADPVTASTPLVGWSMGKSMLSGLVGIMQGEGLIDVLEDHLFPEWEGTGKEYITVENLLQMTSGLDWRESAMDKASEPNQAIGYFGVKDQVSYAKSRPLVVEPGALPSYSSANSMLISALAMERLGGTIADHYQYYQEKLFRPIQIKSVQMEYDTVGNASGGGIAYMTPRDWARYGLLWLNRGYWQGHSVIPEEWIDYALTPLQANFFYGAHVWLNDGRLMPGLPLDTFVFEGTQGQFLFMIPSLDLIVLRMGRSSSQDIADPLSLVHAVMEALQE